MPSSPRPRLNIYLDSTETWRRVKIAAARSGVTASEYCLQAIRRRLSEDGLAPPDRNTARRAAGEMDRLRGRLGPLGIPVRELIDAGRRR